MHASSSDEGCMLLPGTKTRKMHTSARSAFAAINDSPLAFISADGRIETLRNYQRRGKRLELNAVFCDNVGLIYSHPGMRASVLESYLKEYKGIVIAGTGLGHVSTKGDNSLLSVLKKAHEKGIIVCMTSQCLFGRVNPNVYGPLRKLSIEAGCVYCEDLLPETAYVKLGWLLGKYSNDINKVKELMVTDLVGEIRMRHQLEDSLSSP
jgi:glutamyl-tRNA(Gln) amidotransferase subunit D